MFKIKTSRYSLVIVSFLSGVIIFSLGPALKLKILDFVYLPLEVSSSFIRDTKAVVTYKFILNENLRLKQDLSALKADTVITEELRRENQRLKKLLALKDEYPVKTIAAKVIAQEPENWSKGLIINKGKKSGIRTGYLALARGALAGRVIETSDYTAKVLLINDPDSSVGAYVQRSREEGLVSGTLLGGLILRYLEKDSDVVIGDIILALRLSRDLSSSIVIGRVTEVKEAPQGLGKYCVLKPDIDLSRIEEVLVAADK